MMLRVTVMLEFPVTKASHPQPDGKTDGKTKTPMSKSPTKQP